MDVSNLILYKWYKAFLNILNYENLTAKCEHNKNKSLEERSVCIQMLLLELRKTVQTTEQFLNVNFATLGVACYILFFIGIIGNIMSIITVNHNSTLNKCSATVYITALAVSDILLIIFLGLLHVEYLAHDINSLSDIHAQYTAYIYPTMYAICLTLELYSIYLIVAVSIDRFIFVVYPFHAETMCTTSRAWKVVLGIFCLVAVYSTPRWLELKTVTKTLSTNKTYAMYEPTDLVLTPLYRHIVNEWIYLPLCMLIPFIAMVLLNAITAAEMFKINRRGRKLGQQSEKVRDNSWTYAMIIMIAFFVLFQTPILYYNIQLSRNLNLEDMYTWEYMYILSACKLCVAFQASTNFFIYGACCRIFRKHFIEFWLSCLPKCEDRSTSFRAPSHRSVESEATASTQ